MPLVADRVLEMLGYLRAGAGRSSDPASRLALSGAPAERLRSHMTADAASLEAMWNQIAARMPLSQDDKAQLADPDTVGSTDVYSRNVENMIGTVKVPVGLAGPLRVNGLHAAGDYLVPMATTEGALVASYARGAAATAAAGGIAAAVVAEGVMRAPGFAFASLVESGYFVDWIATNAESLKTAADATTRHGRLVAIEPVIDNEIVFLVCRYTTGDASGQNMVTIATEALCARIAAECPVRPRHWFIEANYSGDKKGSYLGLISGRGRKVSASATIPAAIVRRRLHAETSRIIDYARMANLGALLSGQIGAQGHYSNGLAALYLATGQDVACVAESAVGFTRMEDRGGDLYVSVTLPNVLVGTVGGGTGLPSQLAALRLMGLAGPGKAAALAEVTAALCLAGEVSIIAALSAGDFTRAHRRLGRGAR